MAKLSEEALTYVPPTTKNISELKEVDVSAEVKEKTGTKKDGDEFTYKYIEVDGVEYRVGASVLNQLKEHLTAKPDLKKFKVTKQGEGLGTTYTVIPL